VDLFHLAKQKRNRQVPAVLSARGELRDLRRDIYRS
jgi:hypothetical protein